MNNVFNYWHCMLAFLLARALHIEARALPGDPTLVHTTLGAVRGVEQSFEEKKVTAFLGLPYAKPPVGPRRFQKPEALEPWKGEFEARHLAKTCFLTVDNAFPQFPGAEMWNPPTTITEDCLNMNIWVPDEHDGSVIIWIYGGGFFAGSPSLDLYDGTVMAAKKRTIVVNINYRLGPFGFLYFGHDSNVPGNMGLLDQQLALKWIYHNIGSFGGDPSLITLFGESAGSASSTAHMFAPDSYKYFGKIIGNSGSIINSWASRTPDTMLELSLRLAKRLNCSHGDTRAVHKCLQNVPDIVIQTEADKVSSEIGLPMTFAFVPVSADKHFFKGDVFDKLRKRDFKKDVSALLGTVRDEGTYWLPYYMSSNQFGFWFNHTISAEDPNNKALISKQQYRQSMEAFMPYFGNSPLVKNALMNAYQDVSDGKTIEEKFRDGVGRFLGDYFFTCSLIEFADILADNIYGDVYMYYFTLRSSANPWPRWMGVMHGYEIEYAFGQPFWRENLYDKSKLKEEKAFSDIIMRYWTDFATKGNPANLWPKYNRIERKVLELGESTIRGDHRIIVDVHGPQCRLIEEGKAVAGHVSECRGRRMDASVNRLAQSSVQLTVASGSTGSRSLITWVTVFVGGLLFV